MGNWRVWLSRQMRLGRFQEVAEYAFAAVMLFAVSNLCIAIIHDSIVKQNSIFYIASLPIIFFGAWVLIAVLIPTFFLRNALVSNTTIGHGVRFDRCAKILGIDSNVEMLKLIRKHNTTLYISSSVLTGQDLTDIQGKADARCHRHIFEDTYMHRLIGEQRVFLNMKEIETIHNEYAENAIANQTATDLDIQAYQKNIRTLTEDNDRLTSALRKETLQRTAAHAQAADKKQDRETERQKTLVAIKVAIRLARVYDEKAKFTRKQIGEAISDELGPGKDFSQLGEKLKMRVPPTLIELVRDGLPGMVKIEGGAPLKKT